MKFTKPKLLKSEIKKVYLWVYKVGCFAINFKCLVDYTVQ